MRVKLEQRWIKRLLQLPESGMGYQRVDLRLADGREFKDVLAFNAEEVELPDECTNAKIEDVRLRTGVESSGDVIWHRWRHAEDLNRAGIADRVIA